MDREIIKRAKIELENKGVNEKLKLFGDPFYLMVSGAHTFGFPSVDSDIDIRGIYIAPAKKMLGLRNKATEPTFKYMGSDRILDVSIDEIGHYLNIASRSNGNRLEWLNSDLVLNALPEFGHFKDEINKALISKKLFNHYLHFSRDMWEGKTKENGVKRDLYTLRTYMVGITIFEEGVVIPNIRKQNERFGYPIVEEMVEIKTQCEKGASVGYDQSELAGLVMGLDKRLIDSFERSSLPDNPDIDSVNALLINIRESKN